MDSSSRLTTALNLFLACRTRGENPRTLLEKHPELADLLAPMCDDEVAAAPKPDARAFGDFDLAREVGRGGMGVVYEARQRSLGRRVALKILAHDVATSPTQITRFHREARTLARLDHVHIVRVLDVGNSEGKHWLAMEFVDGTSLEERLTTLRASGGHSGGSRRALVQVIADVADALQHVHDAGILHRDVKPSNILLDRADHARLSDFGLARDSSSPTLTQVGVVAGTPHYMSPEHLVGGEALTPRSDIFSLGATLYECVVLERPFHEGSTEQILRDILVRDPVDPRRRDPTVHADLAAIILMALEKEPERRYASASALADDLRAYLELRPVRARPPSRVLRLRRWARREPAKAALAGVLLVLALLAAVVLAQLPAARRDEAARREQAYEDSITQGDLARLSGNKDAALAAFARAREQFPKRSEAAVWQAFALLDFGGATVALDELERACGSDNTDEAVLSVRATLLRALGRDAEAIELEKRLIAPTTPSAMLFTAATLLRRNAEGDLPRANQLMSLAVRMSKQPRLFMYACWAGIAPPEQQRECAEAILALWPDHPLAKQQAAICLVNHDPQRAVQLMQQAVDGGVITKNPNQLLSGMAARAGDTKTAIAAARAALVHDDLGDDLRTSLIVRLRSADPAVAEDEINAWLAREPDNAAALLLRAHELKAKNKFADALSAVQRGLIAQPQDAELGNEHAMLLWKTNALDEAVVVAEQCVATNPTHLGTHQVLALLRRELNDTKGLLAEQRRWVTVRDKDVAAWSALAATLARDAAVPAQTEALRAIITADYLAAGNDKTVLDLRARIHEALGEAAAAAICHERAAALPVATK